MKTELVNRINLINKNIQEEQKYALSVSKCLGYLQKGFDQEGVAQKCFEKGFNDPNSKYYQMTKEAILEAWQSKSAESCRYGSMLDDYIGMCLNKEINKLETWKLDHNYDYDKRLKGLCDGFDQFWGALQSKTDYEYACREQKMFIKNHNGEYINGRFDCLFYSPSMDKYLLIDWKSSGEIEKENKWDKLLGPLYDKDACNGNTYTIQLHMYKKALCETYEITTPDKVELYICQMIPESENNIHFILHRQLMEYKSTLLDNVIEFAYKKHNNAIKQLNS